MPAWSVLDVGEQLLDRADDAPAVEIIAERDGDGRLHRRVMADHLEVSGLDVARRGLEMKNGVEHELEFRAARAEHGVEAGIGRGEHGLRLRLHHPHRQQQARWRARCSPAVTSVESACWRSER